MSSELGEVTSSGWLPKGGILELRCGIHRTRIVRDWNCQTGSSLQPSLWDNGSRQECIDMFCFKPVMKGGHSMF